MQRGRRGWRRWAIGSASLLAVAALCTTAGAVPGTSRSRPMPEPSGAAVPTSVRYAALACRTVGACTAIGSYSSTTSGLTPVADVEGTTGWATPTTIPLPADAASQPTGYGLRSIACPTQVSCFAVGAYVTTATGSPVRPLIADEVGGVWGAASSTIPLPTGERSARLDAIWCNASAICVVVGSYSKKGSAATHAFVDERAAGVWQPSIVLPAPISPKLQGPIVVTPRAIACAVPSACAVVGSVHGNASHGEKYAYGAFDQVGGWATSVFSPFSTSMDTLNAVSCPSTKQCVAVGALGPTLTASSGRLAPLAVGYADGGWHEQWILPWSFWSPSLVAGALTGVSCPSVRRCLAVGELDTSAAGTGPGDTGRFPALYTRTDNVWTGPGFAVTPATRGSVSAGGVLAAITCPSQRYCEAVGTTTPRLASLSGTYPFSTVAQPFFRGTAPSAVTDISITRGHQRFQVRWQGPNRFGGSPIATYVVVARSPKERTIDCVTVTTTCRLYRVIPGHRYTVDIQALNSARRYGPIRRVHATGA